MTEPLDAIIVLPPEQVHFMERAQVRGRTDKVLYTAPFGALTGHRAKAVVWAVDDVAMADGSETIAQALADARIDIRTCLVPDGVLIGFD